MMENSFHKEASKRIKLLSLIALVLTLSNLVLAGAWYFVSTNKSSSIIVTDDKGAYFAESNSELKTERALSEIKKHVNLYLNNMFSHSADTYEERTELALNLAWPSVSKKHKTEFDSKNTYNQYLENNLRTEVTIDSIELLTKTEPYDVFIHFTRQYIFLNSSRNLDRKFMVEAKLNVVDRTKENTHGLIITDWQFVQ